ncbi:NitT/TauT family transport system substrate-binding protein [Methylomagnum ishizawai]|uniref:NitT/TauT family transport system substrate-binding protein n=1 Tax=Methylomagnum ishizawai TaxID=1760988 RepID=A0A1Y6CUX5_9GAMM|nr:transporter substrate-binding domain-containing protein [Methylomagnum ishizawai]SMF94010.1 NitT/TauT family transport system substrate-binding protein [Methylomagnum ishizawai]
MHRPRILPALLLLLGLARPALAEAPPETLRIGVLAFGTLNWELATIQSEGLDQGRGVRLEPTPLASAEAGRIALQGGGVDMIVGDWIWVAQQRGQGADFSFAPYSTSHGALMVPAGSPIQGIADLKGKKLGIAGGGLDKNWLLLRALARQRDGLDLDRVVEKTFGAPPLLNQQLEQGRLDAVLNYWNPAAKLEAQGYRRVLDGHSLLKGLGVEVPVPALGYIFHERWAKAHPAPLDAFLKMATEAQRRLCESDAAWHKIVPLTQETDPKVQDALRRDYCAGRVVGFGPQEIQAAGEIYRRLGEVAGGASPAVGGTLPAGVFWTPPGP